MKGIVSFILAMVLLMACSGCWWHEREEHESGGYGEHEHGGYGDYDRH